MVPHRGTGLVALILLTASVVLGIAEVTRWRSPRFPRFVTAALHKNISLLVLVFLAIHIVTAVADAFAPIGWLDVVLPFHSPYRPLWLGLGAIAVDLLLAVTITSLFRNRIGYRAVARGALGRLRVLASRVPPWSGYRQRYGRAVVSAGEPRVPRGRRRGDRMAAMDRAACPSCNAAGSGPRPPSPSSQPWAGRSPDRSRRGWGRRAGTPTALLGGAVPASATTSIGSLRAPFDALFSGTLSGAVDNARATVTVAGTLSAGATGTLRVVIKGNALASGGVQMDTSSASLGTATSPALYRGVVTSLDGTNLDATVRNAAGTALRLHIQLTISANGTAVSGSVSREEPEMQSRDSSINAPAPPSTTLPRLMPRENLDEYKTHVQCFGPRPPGGPGLIAEIERASAAMAAPDSRPRRRWLRSRIGVDAGTSS